MLGLDVGSYSLKVGIWTFDLLAFDDDVVGRPVACRRSHS